MALGLDGGVDAADEMALEGVSLVERGAFFFRQAFDLPQRGLVKAGGIAMRTDS